MEPISDLEPGSKFTTNTSEDLKGVVLSHGLDNLFYMKKMVIGSETSVIEITDKRKGE